VDRVCEPGSAVAQVFPSSGGAWALHTAGLNRKKKDSGSVPAAVLTLLGLLLGFSFAMAVSRYEARRDLVVQEANSIDKTARRAQLLPEPQAANVERLFLKTGIRYVSFRIFCWRKSILMLKSTQWFLLREPE
jgi:hypothetical protein